jgi:hypothetical protein
MIFKKSMDLMTNGFCYQVINLHVNHSLEQVLLIFIFSKLDIIVPNFETNFIEIKENLANSHRFFLLSKISLDTFLTKSFIDNFLNKGNFLTIYRSLSKL